MLSHGASDGHPESVVEHCPECGGEREHAVTVAVREASTRESIRASNEKYARGPCEVRECLYCGRTTRERLP